MAYGFNEEVLLPRIGPVQYALRETDKVPTHHCIFAQAFTVFLHFMFFLLIVSVERQAKYPGLQGLPHKTASAVRKAVAHGLQPDKSHVRTST